MKKTLLTTFTLLNLLLLNTFAQDKNTKVDLQNIQLDSSIKTSKDYEKKENLLIEEEKQEDIKTKKDDEIKIGGGVDFDKEEQNIDGANVNIGVKF